MPALRVTTTEDYLPNVLFKKGRAPFLKLSEQVSLRILYKPVFRRSTFPWHLLIPIDECGQTGNKTNTQDSERRTEGEERDGKQGECSDYKRGHRSVDREDLSARKRDRKVEGGVDWLKNGRVESTNSRSQRKREGKKWKVSTPGDGKRSKEPKPMEAKTEQTKENESPKIDVTLELGSALGSSHQNKPNRVAKLVAADFSRSKIELS
jgi:hypothetical protein